MRGIVHSAAAAAFAFVALTGASASAMDWNRLYVGVQGGYAWGDAEQEEGPIGGPYSGSVDDADINGFVGGAYAGRNYYSNGWLFGIEGDFEYLGVEGDDSGAGGDVNEFSGDWVASFRARVGAVLDETTLVFATAGLAAMDAELNVLDGSGDTDSVSFTGWTVGGGIETEIASHWSVRVEYRFYGFDSDVGAFSNNGYAFEVAPKFGSARAGVSYHF